MTDRATVLRELHEAPEILVLANVWDPASARAVAAVDGIKALATASHSIAAAHGYEDGENIPLDLHLAAVQRVTAASELPVSMDFEAGYGDPGETTRRAIAAGAVGANLEDQMRPLPEAVAAVEAVVAAREAEGAGFVLNARTDAFIFAREPDEGTVAEAVERGQAFLAAGAECVFVPRLREPDHIQQLVSELGPQRLSVIAAPGVPPAAELERLGVARVSMGPWSYRVALTALQDVAAQLLAGGGLPEHVRADVLP
ncbi:MAG TPA: isocitrate lyase/phosphoenolpyruvate mutase family protein [Thermoleophilaceae bacterium]|nr:isocitrate lyase/phosphoenolpyruvate mutase family protein [Thermoleophilaceae bacterium]